LTYSFCEAKHYLDSALGCLRTHKRDLASADDLSVLRSKTLSWQCAWLLTDP
jgi:hypothetical protein